VRTKLGVLDQSVIGAAGLDRCRVRSKPLLVVPKSGQSARDDPSCTGMLPEAPFVGVLPRHQPPERTRRESRLRPES
jgi:hypothetical protein